MEVETGFIPETEAKRRISLRDVFTIIRNNLREAIWDVYESKKQDPEITAEVKKLLMSEGIGEYGRQYMSMLIPKSRRPPEKKYQPSGEEDSLSQRTQKEHVMEETLKLTWLHVDQTKMPKAEFESIKSGQLASMKGEVSGEVEEFEPKDENDMKKQIVFDRFRQGGGDNLIEEKVVNFLQEKSNYAGSSLAVITSKHRVNLEDLLPEGYRLVPEEMRKAGWKADKEKKEIEYFPIKKDLKDYRGTRGSKGSFYSAGEAKFVAYGDVTKPGGVLNLLHEIGHAWQSVYYEEGKGKFSFEELHKKVIAALRFLLVQKGELTPEEYENFDVPFVKQHLQEMGVEFDEHTFTDADRPLQDGEVKVSSPFIDKIFIVKTDRFDSSLKKYEADERDAWAHGLRLLRHFRKIGIDLDPGMNDLKSIQEHVSPCLESYQHSTEKMIESSTKKIRFSH